MLTNTNRKAINVIAPTLLAGAIAFVLFRSKKSWKVTLIAAGIAWVVGYVVASQLTRVAYTNQPAPVPTGGDCDSYDPTALVDAIYKDIDCVWCLRNKEVYQTLLALTDCQLRKAYNYWNTKYYGDNSESMPVAISKEGSTWDSGFDELKAAVAQKFQTLGLQ